MRKIIFALCVGIWSISAGVAENVQYITRDTVVTWDEEAIAYAFVYGEVERFGRHENNEAWNIFIGSLKTPSQSINNLIAALEDAFADEEVSDFNQEFKKRTGRKDNVEEFAQRIMNRVFIGKLLEKQNEITSGNLALEEDKIDIEEIKSHVVDIAITECQAYEELKFKVFIENEGANPTILNTPTAECTATGNNEYDCSVKLVFDVFYKPSQNNLLDVFYTNPTIDEEVMYKTHQDSYLETLIYDCRHFTCGSGADGMYSCDGKCEIWGD